MRLPAAHPEAPSLVNSFPLPVTLYSASSIESFKNYCGLHALPCHAPAMQKPSHVLGESPSLSLFLSDFLGQQCEPTLSITLRQTTHLSYFSFLGRVLVTMSAAPTVGWLAEGVHERLAAVTLSGVELTTHQVQLVPLCPSPHCIMTIPSGSMSMATDTVDSLTLLTSLLAPKD